MMMGGRVDILSFAAAVGIIMQAPWHYWKTVVQWFGVNVGRPIGLAHVTPSEIKHVP